MSERSKTPIGPREMTLVRSYRVPLPPEARRPVQEFLQYYVRALDKALSLIWESTEWKFDVKNMKRYGKVKVPRLPCSNEFKRRLRNELLRGWPYATNHIDSVIRTAYSIMRGWRTRYLKGKARKKRPRAKRLTARVKKTFVKVDYEARSLRVTLRPGENVAVSWAGAWFEERVQGWEVGEPVLKDDRVILVFKKVTDAEGAAPAVVVGWDCNERTLNGFDGQRFITVSIEPLVKMKEHYEEIIARLQSAGREELEKKYRERLRNREEDFVKKLAAQLAEMFPNAVFAFENLNKEDLVSREVPKERRKRNWRVPWLKIQQKVEEKAPVVRVPAYNTSRTCPRCEHVSREDPGKVFHCQRCGLTMDRQKLAAINIWRRAMKKLFGREPQLPPRFWELPEVRVEVKL